MGNKIDGEFLTVGKYSLKVWIYDSKDSLLDSEKDLYE